MNEWRTIPNFPNYQASSLGQVRRSAAAMGAVVGKVLRPYLHPKTGYAYLLLYDDNGVGKNRGVHTLIASAFLGKKPTADHQVAHADGNRLNNRAANIRWATRKENAQDRELHGNTVRGESHGLAKSRERDILAIRTEYALDRRRGIIRKLSRKFNLSEAQISRIVHHKNWTHLMASTTA